MNVVERYLELGLRAGKHVDELVESYHGPSELSARVDQEDALPPEMLIAEADALLGDLAAADLEPARRRWLLAQVRSLHTTARRLAGQSLPYTEEVELTFGIQPRWYDEEQFERAHDLLDEALPGTGDVVERFARWLETTSIPKHALLAAFESVAAELRERTRDLVGLPNGEEIEIELVSGRRWAASITVSAGSVVASRSTPICRARRRTSRTSWRTRDTPAITPTARGRGRRSFASGVSSKKP